MFLQFAFGFIVFVLPGVTDETKEVFLRFHKFFGVSIFVASTFQCSIGITQQSIFTIKYGKLLYVLLPGPSLLRRGSEFFRKFL